MQYTSMQVRLQRQFYGLLTQPYTDITTAISQGMALLQPIGRSRSPIGSQAMYMRTI